MFYWYVLKHVLKHDNLDLIRIKPFKNQEKTLRTVLAV